MRTSMQTIKNITSICVIFLFIIIGFLCQLRDSLIFIINSNVYNSHMSDVKISFYIKTSIIF